MKKTLLAIAASSALVSMAHAQSSVTLYGLLDASVAYTNNAGKGHLFQAGSGQINSDRWGMRGTEDLGGGLSAIFVLESGFNIQNGTSSQDSRLFGRQAFVGLASKDYGSVTLGRQYDSVVDFLAPLAATGSWGGTWFQHPFDNDNLNNSFRVDNSVKYTSPLIAGGLKLGALYAFSNNTNFALNRLYSFGANYNWGRKAQQARPCKRAIRRLAQWTRLNRRCRTARMRVCSARRASSSRPRRNVSSAVA
jgi:GBP family porin